MQVLVWSLIIVCNLVHSFPIGPTEKIRDMQREIIKQRLTQSINNDNPYSDVEAIIPGQQPTSVLFEPMVHIGLSRSTYKVTTFIEFAPYIQSFRNFEVYLHKFVQDLQDPSRVSGFIHLLTQHKDQVILSNKQSRDFSRFLNNHPCGEGRNNPTKVCKYRPTEGGWDRNACKRQYDMVCRTKSQFKALTDTALYINQSFHQIKEDFLSVIDHLETEEDEGKARERQIHNDKVREELKISYSRLSQESLQTLNKIVERVKDSYPSIRENLRRTKRFGIMSWVLGWGVYSNYRQISTLKRNIQILYQQNLLQEK